MQGKVYQATLAIASRLEAEGIEYAIAGAVAMVAHGYERFTSNVGLLVTPDGLERFKRAYLGRGYVEKYAGSKGLKDTENGVMIDVLLAGDYPGDGLPKPVVFPAPAAVRLRGEHFSVLQLPVLIELKLASGMTAPHRLRDLADVLELIRAASLPRDFADEINPYVREKYMELWHAAQTVETE